MTKETVRADLLEDGINRKRAATMQLIGVAVMCLLVAFFNILITTAVPPEDIVPILLLILLCLTPIVSGVTVYLRAVGDLRRIERGAFTVIRDEVHYKEERRKRHRRLRIKWVLIFFDHGECEVEKTVYELASKNDGYYLVLLGDRAPRPMRIYSEKAYEWVDKTP